MILALGTNDFQFFHANDAWHSSQGIAALLRAIRRAPIEPGMPSPAVLVLVPPPLDNPRGAIAAKFRDGDNKCAGLAEAYARVAQDEGCSFFDAVGVTTSSRVDGVHLDADQHATLGLALCGPVAALLDAA